MAQAKTTENDEDADYDHNAEHADIVRKWKMTSEEKKEVDDWHKELKEFKV